MNWNQLLSTKRLGVETLHDNKEEERSEFQRDYDRLIFSPPFRRLQNKTQVFPLPGSVFVHNRLTHSLEVSCVGRSLGNNISQALIERYPELIDSPIREIGAIVSAACLAHDLGNPPFGHSGEKAISAFFSEGKGRDIKSKLSTAEWDDLIHFEGNANSFRLLTHQFEGRRKGGFVLTYATLASIVKYPFSSQLAGDKSKFGFFISEEKVFQTIADELGIICQSKPEEPLKYARHPLVYLVEAADDICYQVMDIEDAHKLRILTTNKVLVLYKNFLSEKQIIRFQEVCETVSDLDEQIAYLRSSVIGNLIKEVTHIFLKNETAIMEGTFEGSLIKGMESKLNTAYKKCSEIAYKDIYRSSYVVDVELAGYRIITTLLELMTEAVCSPEKTYSKLLINWIPTQYNVSAPTLYGRIQAVLDYVSGMTDLYALDLYRKINGNSLPAV
ncbi:MAG: deoxyguanosinetriphosphate triphosphohydrolase [Phocaeicola sp.]